MPRKKIPQQEVGVGVLSKSEWVFIRPCTPFLDIPHGYTARSTHNKRNAIENVYNRGMIILVGRAHPYSVPWTFGREP